MSLSKALTAAAGNAGGGEALYVEDVFSTYLYTGNGSTQTITNGIDLDGEGGMVWIANRDQSYVRTIYNTDRGATKYLRPSLNGAESTNATTLTSFNADGFSVGSQVVVNQSGNSIVSWTFRKAEKFFDVVTYTGNGTAQNIAHNLGSTPAVIFVKQTSSSSNWSVYHSSLGATQVIFLNLTNGAFTSGIDNWNSTAPTDSQFSVGPSTATNTSGQTYVAYLFASDAGGFGDDGSESIIKCGSYTGTGTEGSPEVNLGFEPQWLIIKNTSSGSTNWVVVDSMRGLPVGSDSSVLYANTSGSESGFRVAELTATGFKLGQNISYINQSGNNYIYIAIRRPMKTPESGTEVFTPYLPTVYEDPYWKSTFPIVDFVLGRWNTNTSVENILAFDRLRGSGVGLETNTTDSEIGAAGDASSYISNMVFDRMYGFHTTTTFSPSTPDIAWMFKRATGFFDVVAYTGTGSNTSINHNLGVAPELMIVKRRNNLRVWAVWASGIDIDDYLTLNGSSGVATFALWQSTQPTATQITLGTDGSVNGSGDTYIAYLFATVAGVSKVGSYTGTGSNVDVDCGFSAGARFILIKRTDSTGDWYVWDSERGIVAGNDPYLLMNSTAAEVTSTDYIDPLSSGFTVTSSAPAALNASGGTYIFLAIA